MSGDDTSLDSKNDLYLQELYNKRIDLGLKNLGADNNDKGRNEILQSINNDNTLSEENKQNILNKYSQIDDLHHSYLDNNPETPIYNKKAAEIILSNVSIEEKKKKLGLKEKTVVVICILWA